jgi:hypothetical protein
MTSPIRPPADAALAHGEASALIVRLLPFIGERRLEPGDRLPSERLLAERFGVTRAIVREAFAKLEAMRVVERRPRSGVYLRAESQVGSLDAIVMKADLGLPFDLRESDHLSEFRSILETQAIELACVRRTQEDIDRLDACMSAAGSGSDAASRSRSPAPISTWRSWRRPTTSSACAPPIRATWPRASCARRCSPIRRSAADRSGITRSYGTRS